MKRYSGITLLVALLVAGFLVLGISNVALAHGGGPDFNTNPNNSGWGPMMEGPSAAAGRGPRGDLTGPRGEGSITGVWGHMQNAWGTMMGGWSSMFGSMMGNFGWTRNGTPISTEKVRKIAEDYVAAYGDKNLEVAEIMAFDNHFYVQAREKDTGRYAFEFLIDRYTGATHPEPGPNMMWNTKYGHMGGSGWGGMMGGGMMGGYSNSAVNTDMPISPKQAVKLAQNYLTRYWPGLDAADDADAFYGYYTIHTLKDGNVVGMLSVNGYTGQVWLHTWHGKYLGMVGDEEH